MEWYKGDFFDAAKTAEDEFKSLIVVVFGTDDESKRLESVLDDLVIRPQNASNHYLCVRIQEHSKEYLAFQQRFKYYPILMPCLYFMSFGNGTSEILTDQGNAKNIYLYLDAKLNSASNTKCSETAPDSSKTGMEQHSTVKENSEILTLEQQLLASRKLASLKHKLKLEKDEAERKRLKLEENNKKKAVECSWKSLKDIELIKRLAEERKQKKKLEEEYRQELRNQIAQDRADRNKVPNTSFVRQKTEQPKPDMPKMQPNDFVGKVRLQFKMPDGSIVRSCFQENNTLAEVFRFIALAGPFAENDFSLSVSLPPYFHKFTLTDQEMSLKDLGLAPSATLLVRLNTLRHSSDEDATDTESQYDDAEIDSDDYFGSSSWWNEDDTWHESYESSSGESGNETDDESYYDYIDYE